MTSLGRALTQADRLLIERASSTDTDSKGRPSKAQERTAWASQTEAPEGADLADTPILDFQPPELGGNPFLVFRPRSRSVEFATTVLANQHRGEPGGGQGQGEPRKEAEPGAVEKCGGRTGPEGRRSFFGGSWEERRRALKRGSGNRVGRRGSGGRKAAASSPLGTKRGHVLTLTSSGEACGPTDSET